MTAPGGWRRPSACAAGDCIEIKASTRHDNLLYLRVNVHGQPGRATVAVTRAELRAFAAACAAGEYDDLIGDPS